MVKYLDKRNYKKSFKTELVLRIPFSEMVKLPIKREDPTLWAASRPIIISPSGGIFDYQGIGKSFLFASSHGDGKLGGPSIDPKLSLKKIMIVDDEDQIAKLYSLILSNHGFTVSDLEYDGSAAVERVSKDGDVDLLIIDQRMPKMDGTTATRKIKQMKPEIKVIMVTAYDISESDRSIFDSVLTKPISSRTLSEAVTSVLSKQ